MTFSDTVAQQRERQEQGLKRFITYSLAGSLVLHGGFLLFKVHDFWQPDALDSEEIAIVVAEPAAEQTEVIPSAESTAEPTESEFVPSGGAGAAGAATIVEAPPGPQVPASAPATPEEPIAEKEPEPASAPSANAEPAAEQPLAYPLTESNQNAAETTAPRNLSNLLEELRRAREQTRSTAANRNSPNGPSVPSSSPGTGGATGNGLGRGSSTTAVGPSGPGSGTGSGQGRGNEAGPGQGNGAGDSDRPQQGSRSREISCRGCDFDYPESADGAEGTAQVMVETDEQGRVVSVTLSGSSGNPELDRAALEQARERVRLEGARAGESYPIEIDFVQPNSEAAERAEERGSRTSITVSEPEPEIVNPATAINQDPEPQPSVSPESSSVSPSSPTSEPPVPPAATVAPDPPTSASPASDPDVLSSPNATDATAAPEPAILPEPIPEMELEPSPASSTTAPLAPTDPSYAPEILRPPS